MLEIYHQKVWYCDAEDLFDDKSTWVVPCEVHRRKENGSDYIFAEEGTVSLKKSRRLDRMLKHLPFGLRKVDILEEEDGCYVCFRDKKVFVSEYAFVREPSLRQYVNK